MAVRAFTCGDRIGIGIGEAIAVRIGQEGRGDAFVDKSITIVVDAIADLVCTRMHVRSSSAQSTSWPYPSRSASGAFEVGPVPFEAGWQAVRKAKRMRMGPRVGRRIVAPTGSLGRGGASAARPRAARVPFQKPWARLSASCSRRSPGWCERATSAIRRASRFSALER